MNPVFKNVWFLCTLAVVVYLITLFAAYQVGVFDGSFGCNGGLVGALIAPAAGLSGLLIGIASQFTPKPGDKELEDGGSDQSAE